MKKYKLIFAFFTITTLIVIVSACSEKDLELKSPTDLSPETFFTTEAQVQSAVNAIYSNMQTRGLFSRHMFFSQDNMSHENSGNPQLEADKKQYLDFSFDANHGPIADYWDSCYRGINKANFVIGNSDKINAISEAALSSQKKGKYIGEAKFLRAFFNFLLVTRFGDMPLISSIPENGAGFPKSPKADVYAQIILDLKDASTTLLDKADEENGRATKGAAFAMLGKAYLFIGEHQLALNAFKEVKGYDLEPDFYDNFKEETEHGIESIFEVEYNDDLGTGNQWDSSVTGAGLNEATFRGQEYGCLDWFNVYPSDDLLDEYEAGDSRYADTFYSVGDSYAGGAETILATDLDAGGQRRAGWKKYQNYYKDKNEDQESGINMKYLRYADVLLMMAECENEVGTQATAVGYINQVRSRASLIGLELTLSKSEVFAAIVHERKVELAGEQVRFNDIIRWGIAATELTGTNFQAGKHEVWPIPNREISSNENVNSEDQNSGY